MSEYRWLAQKHFGTEWAMINMAYIKHKLLKSE